MVTNTPAMIEQLEEQGYDVGFVGEPYEAAVYVTGAEEAKLRAAGYKIGQTLEDESTWKARKREIAEADRQIALSGEFARAGISRNGVVRDGKKIVPTPGVVVIQRAYTFTNYAGRFLYVEAHNKLHTDTAGPAMSFAYAGPDGEFRPAYSMSNSSISPDGNDAGIGGNKISDGDAAPGSRYMYHRALVALRGDDANLQASQITVRVSDADGNNDTSGVTEWANEELPPRVANFQKDFITKYMDPTEAYQRLDQLASEFPDIAEIVNLPYKTNGYQREAMAMLAPGTNPDANPSGANSPSAVQLFSKAMGHLGGNDITAEFRDPGAPNSPLSVTVDGKDITVNLGTDENGNRVSTAAQVVDAINNSPAASALVTAYTYNNNAGAGVVPPHARVQLDDYLEAPDHVQRGPFQMRVLRIGKVRDGSKTGVFIYCQQHAREWVTPITCVETAERLVRNYAIDATTKEYVDNLDIFILPSSNPDGGHVSFYDRASQRRNLTRYCPLGGTGGNVGNRGNWGVDLNRNNSVGTLFDGYNGASSSCTSDTFAGPFEVSEPEIKNEQWVADTFPKIKFAINIHTHGGYFMWAPGAYIREGRVTLPAPNIGIENYFFDVADTILSHIKSSRNTVILPQRTGPIADVLYSAAGNSADDQYYRKGIIAYSFEAGAQRISVNPTTGSISRTSVGFQPCFAGPGTNGGTGGTCGTEQNPNPLLVNEGHDSAMEFADGNYGLIHGALEYARDETPPNVEIEYSTDRATAPPINYRFKWVDEPAIILYTTDGSTPTVVPDDPATLVDERCFNETSTKCYQGQGPRMPGEVLQIDRLGIHDIKWMAVDIKGNQSAVKTQRFIVGPEGEVSGTVPPTLSLSLGTPASFGAFTPGVDGTYDASTTANVISSAGDGLLSVSDPDPTNTGKLVNGSFTLAQPLQASASSAAGTGAAFAPVGGSANPTNVLTYSGPTSNDSVTLNFRQSIGRTEALRTGSYSKTLTFTLSTTQP
ncbi:MAG TPA: M14 family zinc carboxypeptidase [Solirubrobacter sp.]|nr:M14 family zinc carboxypeptidase [Solirubrobacter sp.]